VIQTDFEEQDVPHLHCGNCKHFSVWADMRESFCKRIDHKKIKFAIPWFACYDCGQRAGTICSDFELNEVLCPAIAKEWKGFGDYWTKYVETWLPYHNTDTGIGFTLNGDTSIRYKVKLLDYVYGTMLDENGKLKAYEKVYYKQDRDPKGYGYHLVREPIDGVSID
jgi:hypothetical protein